MVPINRMGGWLQLTNKIAIIIVVSTYHCPSMRTVCALNNGGRMDHWRKETMDPCTSFRRITNKKIQVYMYVSEIAIGLNRTIKRGMWRDSSVVLLNMTKSSQGDPYASNVGTGLDDPFQEGILPHSVVLINISKTCQLDLAKWTPGLADTLEQNHQGTWPYSVRLVPKQINLGTGIVICVSKIADYILERTRNLTGREISEESWAIIKCILVVMLNASAIVNPRVLYINKETSDACVIVFKNLRRYFSQGKMISLPVSHWVKIVKFLKSVVTRIMALSPETRIGIIHYFREIVYECTQLIYESIFDREITADWEDVVGMVCSDLTIQDVFILIPGIMISVIHLYVNGERERKHFIKVLSLSVTLITVLQ